MRVVDIIGDGAFDGEVIGESNYQDAIEKIVGGRTEESQRFVCEAMLVREPTNPHDGNAVRVEIRGELVGYIPREEAEEIGEFLIESGGIAAVGRCKAMIVGGWSRRTGDGSFGVKLDMAWPCEAVRVIPAAPYSAACGAPQRHRTSELPVWSKTVTAVATAAILIGAMLLWRNSRPNTPAPPPAQASSPAVQVPPAVLEQAPPEPPPPATQTRPAPKPANVPLPPPRPRELK